ncbi:MAG: dockerin type I domain-containing protein [Anaerolineae bacterium]
MKVQHAIVISLLVLVLLGLAAGPQPAQAAGTTYTVNAALADNSACASAHLCKTIAAAITAAGDGDSINVLAGTYVENVVVSKQLTLTGAGEGVSIIYPAVSAPNPCSGSSLCGGAASNIILVQANNVTISGFTLDGDNPNLTSTYNAGGANLDARNGIITNHAVGVYNNLVIANVTVKNIYLRGIYASSGGTFNIHDNIVQNVQGETQSIAVMNFGGSGIFARNTVSDTNDGVVSNWSTGTQYLGNIITNSGSGVHTDNAGGNGGTADLLEGNTVSNCKAGGYGVWVFVPTLAPTVKSNHVTNCAVGLAMAGGITPPVTTTFSNNVVDGGGLANSVGIYLTTDEFGWGYGNVAAVFSGNSITNNTVGVQVEKPGGMSVSGTFSQNNISGNTSWGLDTGGVSTLNVNNNWWGSAAGPVAPNNVISGTVTITGNAKALITATTASTHEIGEVATLDTHVTITGLYGAQLLVNHDNSILNFTATGSTANGVASTPPWAWDYMVANFTHPTVNQTELAGTMQRNLHAVGANLTGQSIATWKYTCAAPGTSGLAYDTTANTGTLLSDINGMPIIAAVTGDSVTCTLATSAVNGYIGLQGRLAGAASPAGWNDAVATLNCTAGACLSSGPYAMTTDINGLYQRLKPSAGSGIPNGTYTMTVTRRAYLPASKASISISGGSVTITPLTDPQVPTLLGGDVNGDNTIDIADLAAMGGAFGTAVTPDTGPDVNGDGYINIFDLVLAGGNYGLSSQTW